MADKNSVAYDCERQQGIVRKRNMFSANYMIQRYWNTWEPTWWMAIKHSALVDNTKPDYIMMLAVGWERYRKISGVIYNNGCETLRYYTMESTNDLIMASSLTGQYFVLEKLKGKEETEAVEQAKEWSEQERKVTEEDEESIFQEVYGDYIIKSFLPTRYYDDKDDVLLSCEETEAMIGKEIT